MSKLEGALTLEEAGRVDDALASYHAALEVAPQYIPAIQGLARLSVRSGHRPDQLEGWLGAISQRADSLEWADWARLQLEMARSSLQPSAGR